MKCVECVDYAECSKKHNLTIKRKHCPVAKAEYVQTNADRIRAMSDEELAVALMEDCKGREWCVGCPAEKCLPKCPGENYGAWEEWLKQPAEVDGNG